MGFAGTDPNGDYKCSGFAGAEMESENELVTIPARRNSSPMSRRDEEAVSGDMNVDVERGLVIK